MRELVSLHALDGFAYRKAGIFLAPLAIEARIASRARHGAWRAAFSCFFLLRSFLSLIGAVGL